MRTSWISARAVSIPIAIAIAFHVYLVACIVILIVYLAFCAVMWVGWSPKRIGWRRIFRRSPKTPPKYSFIDRLKDNPGLSYLRLEYDCDRAIFGTQLTIYHDGSLETEIESIQRQHPNLYVNSIISHGRTIDEGQFHMTAISMSEAMRYGVVNRVQDEVFVPSILADYFRDEARPGTLTMGSGVRMREHIRQINGLLREIKKQAEEHTKNPPPQPDSPTTWDLLLDEDFIQI